MTSAHWTHITSIFRKFCFFEYFYGSWSCSSEMILAYQYEFRHAHQRSPVSYKSDCLAILKRVLDHDDTDSDRSVGQKLQTGFKDTCELWELTFGTIYVKAGVMYRGDQPAPVPPPLRIAEPVKETSLFSVEQQQQEVYLTRRQTVQV